jgi:hypothetical protein
MKNVSKNLSDYDPREGFEEACAPLREYLKANHSAEISALVTGTEAKLISMVKRLDPSAFNGGRNARKH